MTSKHQYLIEWQLKKVIICCEIFVTCKVEYLLPKVTGKSNLCLDTRTTNFSRSIRPNINHKWSQLIFKKHIMYLLVVTLKPTVTTF